MKKLFALILCFPLLAAAAQTNKGIRFVQAPGWQQVLAKAKAENKYIFVDAYATWCVSCKQMAEEIFPQQAVGDYYNTHFISISVQMDETPRDSAQVKAWAADAKMLMKKFKITAFPTFLYLTPEGKPVGIAVGTSPADKFVAIAADALSYAQRMEKFAAGKLETAELAAFAKTAKAIGDDVAANSAAAQVISGLKKQSGKDALTADSAAFLAAFTQSSKDPGFSILYYNKHRFNVAVGDTLTSYSYADELIDDIILRERVYPVLDRQEKGQDVHWDTLRTAIAVEYGMATAERVISKSQISWYAENQNWTASSRSVLDLLRNYGGLMTDYYINSLCWEVLFTHCDDKALLEKALSWMEAMAWTDPDSYSHGDTYANLLYKVGRVEEALAQEEQVLARVQALAWEEKSTRPGSPMNASYASDIVEFKSTIEKMKAGQPTWPHE